MILRMNPKRCYSNLLISLIPYSQKYWRSLNSAVWPQTDHTKILEFKFGGGISGPFIKERCRLSLEVLDNKAMSLQIYKK